MQPVVSKRVSKQVQVSGDVEERTWATDLKLAYSAGTLQASQGHGESNLSFDTRMSAHKEPQVAIIVNSPSWRIYVLLPRR